MIQVSNLNIGFNGSSILSNINFHVKKGEIFTLTGDSGRGKSSLFSVILGFLQPESGEVYVNNTILNSTTVSSIRNLIGWLPQNLSSLPNLSIESQIHLFKSFKRNSNNFMINEFEHLIERFRLRTDILKASYSELSGGEKQRIALIYCLLQKKPILLLDEPTSALDDTSEQAVTNYLKESKELTILASSHSDYWISQSDKTMRI
jgi:ABC-type multidrug transport system ATPase subunit